jgi:hypothetical protein
LTTATHVLNVARSQLGFVEGRGNRNPYGPALGWPSGQPYCDEFVSWVAREAGAADIIGRQCNCASHVAWFRTRGQFGRIPRTGAVVFFDWRGDHTADHVGFVESVMDGQHVVTIEGNTEHPTAAGRQGVWRRIRWTGLVLGYGYPSYTSSRRPVLLPAPASHRGHVVPLVIDGAWGPLTTARLQQWLHVPVDGVRGPITVRALQGWVGCARDGVLGPITVKRLQQVLRVPRDGHIGPITVRALQRWLNRC